MRDNSMISQMNFSFSVIRKKVIDRMTYGRNLIKNKAELFSNLHACSKHSTKVERYCADTSSIYMSWVCNAVQSSLLFFQPRLRTANFKLLKQVISYCSNDASRFLVQLQSISSFFVRNFELKMKIEIVKSMKKATNLHSKLN